MKKEIKNGKTKNEKIEITAEGRTYSFEAVKKGEADDIVNPYSYTRANYVTVYQTSTNKYVVHAEYTTQWQGETNSSSVRIFETLEDLHEFAEDNELVRKALVNAQLEKRIEI